MNTQKFKHFMGTLILLSLLVASGGGRCGDGGSELAAPSIPGTQANCGSVPCKPLPTGIYESAGSNPVDNAVDSTALQGVLVRVSWNVCGDDQSCLFGTIQDQLDKALAANLKVSLLILDGDDAPSGVKARCAIFNFVKRGVTPASMCLPWDVNYLADKQSMISALGQRFDSHPALAYMYFTGACSTNGAEGHCRVDEVAYTAAGYTPTKLASAYLSIMDTYRNAFPTTPIIFEVHAIFDSANLWQSVWDHVSASGRVGVAAWWCSERLSIKGNDTVLIWPIVQAAAQTSFTVCQTVGNFTNQPYRFSDLTLGLDYGEEANWNQADTLMAFEQTMDWAQGYAVHAGQDAMVFPFSVIEIWTVDMANPDFQSRLRQFQNAPTLPPGALTLRDAIYLYNQPLNGKGDKILAGADCDVFQLVMDVTSGYTNLAIGQSNSLAKAISTQAFYADTIQNSDAMFAYALYQDQSLKTFVFNDRNNPSSPAQMGSATIFGYCYSTKPTAHIYFQQKDSCTNTYSDGRTSSCAVADNGSGGGSGGEGSLTLRDAIYLYGQALNGKGDKTLAGENCDVFQLILDVNAGYTDLALAQSSTLNNAIATKVTYPDRILDSAAMFSYALYENQQIKTFVFNDKNDSASSAQIGTATAFGYCYSTKPNARVYLREKDQCTDRYSNGQTSTIPGC